MVRTFFLCLLLSTAAFTSASKCDSGDISACSDDSDPTTLLQSRMDMNKLATDGFTRYWVDDGCHSEIGVQGDLHSENMIMDDVSGHYHDVSDEVAGPRCCDDAGTSCSTPKVAGSTCLPMTFAQASKVCNDEGKRLCTKSELLSEICCGTGGNCDSHAVWTSTPEYTKYGSEACLKTTDNELAWLRSTDLPTCAAKCSQDATCVSFEFWPHDTSVHPTEGHLGDFCRLLADNPTQDCTAEMIQKTKLGAYLYVKADDFAPADGGPDGPDGDLPAPDGPDGLHYTSEISRPDGDLPYTKYGGKKLAGPFWHPPACFRTFSVPRWSYTDNELTKFRSTDLPDCAAKCSQDATCVSFEFWPRGTHPTEFSNNFCQLLVDNMVKGCTLQFLFAARQGADLYVKADDNAPADGGADGPDGDLPAPDGPDGHLPALDGPVPAPGGELRFDGPAPAPGGELD